MYTSLRGMGEIDNNGYITIKKLLSYDFVSDTGFRDSRMIREKEKSIKRIYSELDPYGEENWDE